MGAMATIKAIEGRTVSRALERTRVLLKFWGVGTSDSIWAGHSRFMLRCEGAGGE